MPRPESSQSSNDDIEDTGISRRRLDPNEARSHFLPSEQASLEIGYIGRVKSKRRAHQESGKRAWERETEQVAVGDSSEDDEGTLEVKLVRLRREVAEVKAAFERKKTQGTTSKRVLPESSIDSVNELEEVLGSIGPRDPRTADGAAARLARRLNYAAEVRPNPAHVADDNGNNAEPDQMYTFSYAPTYDQERAIAKVADFDKRLTILESVLGIDAIAFPSQARPQAKAVLPALEQIDRQISIVANSTDSKLDAVNRRVKQLTQDAQRLTDARKSAKAAQEALSSTRDVSRSSLSTESEKDSQGMAGIEDPEHISKVNALYGTLPTIESLSPVLPSLLDRLRSLRSLHVEAAIANQSLVDIESRQAATADDLSNWRDGLEKVEKMFEQGQKTMGENMSAVEGWVKELEQRLQMTDR